SGTADLGKFDEATVSLRVLGGEESGEAGESFWYVETGRRGAALRPGVPLRLARPEGTVRIESDRHGPFREFLFYPGKTYELVVTVAGAKGLASQRVRFMVAP
ncbi:MAG: hypothetical protein HUU04_11065, partial [Verrucomicrobiae bacterium]|nr:hypothetical protein [Verrucomicrobiae bacterium]